MTWQIEKGKVRTYVAFRTLPLIYQTAALSPILGSEAAAQRDAVSEAD